MSTKKRLIACAPVTLWLTDVELNAALDCAILRDIDAMCGCSAWTDRGRGHGNAYYMVAHQANPHTPDDIALEFRSVSV